MKSTSQNNQRSTEATFEEWAIFKVPTDAFINCLIHLGIIDQKPAYQQLYVAEETVPRNGPSYCHINLGFEELDESPRLEDGIASLLEAINNSNPTLRVHFSGDIEAIRNTNLLNKSQIEQFENKLNTLISSD